MTKTELISVLQKAGVSNIKKINSLGPVRQKSSRKSFKKNSTTYASGLKKMVVRYFSRTIKGINSSAEVNESALLSVDENNNQN